MNIENRTLFIGNNLTILREIDTKSIDLIYLDPPFNSNKKHKGTGSIEKQDISFRDIWNEETLDDYWHEELMRCGADLYDIIDHTETLHSKSMRFYLIAMTLRLFELRRILKDTGSIYLHCDPTASHYLKLVMDKLFGKENFKNELIWKRTTAHSVRSKYASVHDVLFYYIKSESRTWNEIYSKHTEDYIADTYCYQDSHGIYASMSLMTGGIVSQEDSSKGTYRLRELVHGGITDGESGKPWRNVDPSARGQYWKAPLRGVYATYIEKNFIPNYTKIKSVHTRLDLLDKAGLIHWPKRGSIPRLKHYLAGNPGKTLQDLILDIQNINASSKERTGYPTQKPLALLERIIKVSSNPGDIILDPFCGSGTTCIAAENLGRKWIGIDSNSEAIDICESRFDKAFGLFAQTIRKTL